MKEVEKLSNHFGLSDIEYELMCFFWDQPSPVTFAEILQFCNESMGWDWAKTTAHTRVTRLMQKGLLDMRDVKGERRTYFAKVSREEFVQGSFERLLDFSAAGSVGSFLLSFVPRGRLSRQEAEELHRVLDELAESEEPSEE